MKSRVTSRSLRAFLITALALAVVASLSACSQAPKAAASQESGAFAIIQGATDLNHTQFAVITPKVQNVIFSVQWMENGAVKTRVLSNATRTTRDFSPMAVDQIFFEGLKPGITYQLDVKDADNGNLLDTRTFRTLDLTARGGKVAVVSCMDDFYKNQQRPMWEALLEQRPDLLFLIGDNVYVDRRNGQGLPPESITPTLLWERYIETLTTLYLYRAPHLVPIFTVWDDHDFGINDSDTHFKLKDESKRIYETFFPQREWKPFFRRGPGVSSVLHAWGVRFFLLDDRTWRENNPAHESHFGGDQEAWLSKTLAESSAPAVLMDGDQWFGDYQPRFENFKGRHPKTFERFVKGMRTQKSVALLVSGDRHLIELMKFPKEIFGYETYELTTSAIHAILSHDINPKYWGENPNKYRIEGTDSEYNFATIDISSPRPFQLTLRGHGWAGKVLFEHPVTIERTK